MPALNLRVGVITENGLINASLIENAFARRVNSNWRVLKPHTLSYVLVNVSSCDSQQAVRTLCTENGLSALIGIGSCSLLDQVSSLSKSLQLPLIALPAGLCDSAQLIKDNVAIGTHSLDDMVAAAASVIVSDSVVSQVAILFDGKQSPTVVQNLQSSLTSARVSSLTFQVDNNANASVTPDLVQHLLRLVKMKVFKLLMLATPSNALSVLKYASDAGVTQQNYFWLILDTGLSKADVRSVTPANANFALLRGGVFTECTAAVMDVFDQCDIDRARTLDVRFVDAVEALAKTLSDSLLLDPGFSPSNASCAPLRRWASGSAVFNRLIAMSNHDTQRGIISYNMTSRHFSSQGVQVVASYNEQRWSPTSFLQSAVFDPPSGTLRKSFRYKGASLAFPNTFKGFKNETIIICTPQSPPKTVFVEKFANNTVIISGMIFDLLTILSVKLDFRFITKDSDDSSYGSPQPGLSYFTGCVGELQRGLVTLAAGTFTKTSVRSAVVDFSTPLFQESSSILVPRPPPESKVWNVFTPFSTPMWFAVVGSIAFGALATWLAAFFCPFSAYNLQLDNAFVDEIWLQEYVWSALGSFLLQGQDFYPFAMSPRTVMAFWWMFTVIVYGAFTADLTAHLTVSVTDFPIKTLADLAAQDRIKPIVADGTNLYTLFADAKSGVYKAIADKMVVIPASADCPTQPPRIDQACLADYTTQLAISIKNCSQFYLANELFNTATVAFVYPKDAFYAHLFDLYLQEIHETGLMQRFFNIYWSTDAPCSIGTSTDADSIDLEGVGGCFFFTGCLYAAGLVFLAIELAWTRLLRKQPVDCVLY